MPHHADETMLALRRRVAAIQGAGQPAGKGLGRLALGIAALDRMLGGGFALGALHEITPAAPPDFGAAVSFALALLARALAAEGAGDSLAPEVRERADVPPENTTDRSQPGFLPPAPAGRQNPRNEFLNPHDIRAGRAVLWIEPEAAAFEGGALYGPGLELLGLPMARLIGLRVAHERDGAWAMEEALRCRAVAAVVGEFAREKSSLDLTMLRRLALAAGEGGGLGLLLRHYACPQPSPAVTRSEIAAAPGARDAFGGLGRPAVVLSLVRNRRGPTGRWLLAWDCHERAFHSVPLPLDLAPAAADGPPDAAPRRRAG
jgi:protein ImuA